MDQDETVVTTVQSNTLPAPIQVQLIDRVTKLPSYVNCYLRAFTCNLL